MQHEWAGIDTGRSGLDLSESPVQACCCVRAAWSPRKPKGLAGRAKPGLNDRAPEVLIDTYHLGDCMKKIILGAIGAFVMLLALIYLAGGAQRRAATAAGASPPAAVDTTSSSGDSDLAQEAKGGTAEPATTSTASSAVDAAMRPVAPPVLPPLPPAGTPVVEILETLKARAAQGDSSAMCRLGRELQRCAEARRTQSVSSTLEGDLARRPDTPAGAPEMLARMQDHADQFGKGCEGVPEEDLALAFDMQMRAAEARPELRVWAALNPALDPWNFVNELEQWQRYRAQAMPWLEQAAAEGDVSAIIALQRVHGDLRRNGPPFPRFRIPDPERFVLYTDLLKRYGVAFPVVQREYASRRAALEPDALARIDRRVQELHRAERVPLDGKQSAEALAYSMRTLPEPEDCVAR